MAALKIGTLAKRTGVSIRTLRYYDEIGLLRPNSRSSAGYRLYGTEDVARLQQILSLRALGFSLDAIQTCLAEPTFSALHVVNLHREQLQHQLEHQQRLARRLDLLAHHLAHHEAVSLDDLLQTIEDITMIEHYYTPDQLAQLKARADALGEAGLRQAEADWQRLFDDIRVEMDQGTDPTSPAVMALAERYQALIQAFTGGDPGIAASLKTMYEQEGPEKASRGMADPALMAYMRPALEAL